MVGIDSILAHHFISGMKPELRQMVKYEGVQSFDEAWKIALRRERSLEGIVDASMVNVPSSSSILSPPKRVVTWQEPRVVVNDVTPPKAANAMEEAVAQLTAQVGQL